MARLANSSVNLVIKYLLFFINFIVFLVSGAVAGLMIWILVEKEKTVSSIYDFFLDGACIFLLVSLIAFVVSFLGWIGAFRENICCLKGYHWTMTILFFVQIVIVILIFVVVFVPEARNQLGIYPEDSLRVAIEKYRDDPDMQNLIDNFQLTFKCCGISNDESGYKDWTNNMYFNCSDAIPDSMKGKFEFCSVPFSCCIDKDSGIKNLECGKRMQSADPLTRTAAIHTDGCLKAITDFMNNNVIVVGGVLMGVFIPQMVMSWLSRKLITQIYKQMAKWNQTQYRPR
ncbi:tetraspanin-33-like [Mya arenaria]|uniref:tetraspanin-33-like n=1 Tax=Mya arenaria TaxID=6604 RepID=UPI0022E6A002|nr:tetraspanin-33-like [Mya arenaria]